MPRSERRTASAASAAASNLRDEIYGHFERFVRDLYSLPIGSHPSPAGDLTGLPLLIALMRQQLDRLAQSADHLDSDMAITHLDALLDDIRREQAVRRALARIRAACDQLGSQPSDHCLNQAYAAINQLHVRVPNRLAHKHRLDYVPLWRTIRPLVRQLNQAAIAAAG